MRKVINEAKRITKDNTMKLYFPLTADEVRKMDEEYYIKQGLEQGLEQGILKNQKDMILKMYQENVPIEKISLYSSLSISEVEKIINEKE